MIWLCLFFAGSFARAFDGPFARAGQNFQNAATYQGRTTLLTTGYRRGRAYSLGLNADLTERRYTGGVQIKDQQYYLAGSRAVNEHVYVDGAAGLGVTTDIYARYGATVTPHFVFDRNDFGLGLRFAEYRTGQTGTLTGSYLHYFANGLTLGGATNVVRAATSIASYQLTSIYAPDDHHTVRATGAAGRTLEDRGLEARFNSLALEYTYACTAGWSAGLAWIDYWSEVRRERVIGLRLGWR